MPKKLTPGRACIGALLGIVLWVPSSYAGALEEGAAVGSSPGCLRHTPQASVVELLEIMGVFEQARAQTKAMVEQLRGENPKVPQAFWSDFSSRVAARDALVSLYAPIYLRHLSQQDVCALASFYRTPLGAHFLHAGPMIRAAMRDAVQAWATMITVELLAPVAGESPAQLGPQVARAASQAQPVDERTEAIHELLRRSGDLAAAQRMMGAKLDRLRQGPQQISLPANFWDAARQRLLNEDDLLRLWTPAYARRFTDAEVRELLEFFRSPVGLRYVGALPAIEAESVDAGEQLGRTVAKRAVREVYGPLPQWRLLHPASPGGAAPDSRPGNPAAANPQ
jgi:uncharacterized protein